MNIKKAIAIIGTLSLIGCNLWSCSDNKTSDKSSDSAAISDSSAESETTGTTEATAAAVQTTEAEELTEPATEPENNISEEEQAKIDDACIALLTEFTKMEGYNPYEYSYQYMMCDINEDGIDELIVHYMSMLGETEALYYYEDGVYSEIASASESGIDICIDRHFIQFSSWDGRDSRNIVEVDGKEFKKDVISILPEGYQHNDVEISEDEFNKLNEKYDSYNWEKPEFDDFSNILPESVAFPEIDFGDTGNNNGGGISIDPIVGTWELSYWTVNDQPMNDVSNADFGYVFNADGTGYLYNEGSQINFTYNSTGIDSYEINGNDSSTPIYGYIENGYFVSQIGIICYYCERSY